MIVFHSTVVACVIQGTSGRCVPFSHFGIFKLFLKYEGIMWGACMQRAEDSYVEAVSSLSHPYVGSGD